jgi:phosphate transport system substrate-binding protein
MMQFSTRLASVSLLLPSLAMTMGLVACGPGTPPADTGGAGTSATAGGGGSAVTLNGAGASFPAPLYQRWFSEYNKVNANVQVNYQSVGSGAGVEQFTQGTVDFGASDVGMKSDEIAKIKQGALLLPVTGGGIVVAYNLPDVKELKLSRTSLIELFQGKIAKWNDPKLAKDNPDAKLPDLPVAVVTRSDGSGTTAVFTSHLSAISPEWKGGPGDGKSIQWPVGTAAKGNEGVTAQVQQTQGAIGYIEYGYAKENAVPFATLQNKAGQFVTYTPESAAQGLENVKLADNLLGFAPDPEGDGSYPIVTYTWVLAYQKYNDANKANALKEVLEWSIKDGQKLSAELGYVPLPTAVAAKVEKSIESIQ